MSRYWRDLKTTDLDGDNARRIAVLPLAAIEQHGPHLPLGTDAMIAEGMVARAAAALPEESPALFLPVQQVGKSTEHVNFPGTLSLSWQATIQSWLDIGESLAHAGITKLLLITSHGGNRSAMEIVGRELRARHAMMVVSTAWESLGAWPRDAATHTDIHGGEYETSLMLALCPDAVDMDAAKDFASTQSLMREDGSLLGHHSSPATLSWLAGDLNREGTVGNAAAATAEKGEAEIATIASNFATLVARMDEMDWPPEA